MVNGMQVFARGPSHEPLAIDVDVNTTVADVACNNSERQWITKYYC